MCIRDRNITEVIKKSETPNLDLIQSSIDLVGIEIELVDQKAREYKLKKKIDEVRNLYDFILIDCAPSLGLITLNALTSSNSVLIPIQCEYLALEGLGKLLNTIKSIQKIHNENLLIEGLLLTMYDTRLNLSNQVKKEVKTHFNEMVFKTVIHRNVRLGEATSYGKSIIDYDVSSKGADNYLNLAKELISKHNLIRKINSKYTLYCSPGHFIRFNNDKIEKKFKNYLFKHQVKKKFQYSLEWEKNQLAIWDNRSMLHQATAFKGDRIMHRITVQ